jgi:hypothetical protein
MSDDVLFGDRFLTRYAGQIIVDPATAIVELVANAWDAHATRVDITWPDGERKFAIRDDGAGMTTAEFLHRWRMLDYERLVEQGDRSVPPPDMPDAKPRAVYGRNGKGRHAAFLFANPYLVRTWRDGREATFAISRGNSAERPFDVERLVEKQDVEGHGTEITGSKELVGISASTAREIIGARFLTDPSFVVTVNGTTVSFEDLSDEQIVRTEVAVPGLGTAVVMMIDAQRVDRTTRQHGIAWWVNNRLVGDCRWRGTDLLAVVDGRSSEAKRFTFIVFADFLEDSVKEDWSDFDQNGDAWKTAYPVIVEHIRKLVREAIASRRAEAKMEVRQRLSAVVRDLPPLSHERWDTFVDQVVETCPSITTDEITQVAGILARLEASTSKYELISKLHDMEPGDFDTLNRLLTDWTVRTVKEALDEIKSRLGLIREMHQTLRDERADEVRDLQPLFERSLWAFGPEFESLEFTSNRGMSTVISQLFGKKRGSKKAGGQADPPLGSLKRPDFAILPDSSVGLYSRPDFGDDGEPIGVAHLVIVELKKPGVEIGAPQMEQARGYARELRRKGLIELSTKVTCFVLGSKRDAMETEPVEQGSVRTQAVTFETFIVKAERRMLNLYSRLQDAPFLKENDVDLTAFGEPKPVRQHPLL